MGEIKCYFERSKDILERYHIEKVKKELYISNASRTSECVKDQASSQDNEKLHAKMHIYYAILQNINGCIEALKKGIDEPEKLDNENFTIYAEVDNSMEILEIFKDQNDVYKNEVELESKEGLKSLKLVKVEVKKLVYKYNLLILHISNNIL